MQQIFFVINRTGTGVYTKLANNSKIDALLLTSTNRLDNHTEMKSVIYITCYKFLVPLIMAKS